MLEITGEDIARLTDGQLRELVARLCEAEMRKRALSASAVTWGGDQDAPDGGIDVRVELPSGFEIGGFIPRRITGFQVKKPDLAPSRIHAEMRPGGTIRRSIQSLANECGAYIIVCGSASASNTQLTNRREAMAVAVRGISGGSALVLDFYDRVRIATWLRDHPGLVPWVRQKAGRPISGWQSYGRWANPAEDSRAEYLADDIARIRTRTACGDRFVAAVEGIERIRGRLREKGASARLVGLSGVGKTRLAEALFDDRLGADALDPALAIYTNLGDGPEPSPVAMVSHLLAGGMRAIMVVDNCPPDLHRRLTELVGAEDGQVSILTIEYDIREDRPEDTQVFEMEPASPSVTKRLVHNRFAGISQVDAERIAESLAGTREWR